LKLLYYKVKGENMKKLLLILSLAAIMPAIIQAAPIAHSTSATSYKEVYKSKLAVSFGEEPFTFTLVGKAEGGTVNLNPKTGEYTFIFKPNSTAGRFSYRATDALGEVSNTAIVEIKLKPGLEQQKG
jgi:hypothetical protein